MSWAVVLRDVTASALDFTSVSVLDTYPRAVDLYPEERVIVRLNDPAHLDAVDDEEA